MTQPSPDLLADIQYGFRSRLGSSHNTPPSDSDHRSGVGSGSEAQPADPSALSARGTTRRRRRRVGSRPGSRARTAPKRAGRARAASPLRTRAHMREPRTAEDADVGGDDPHAEALPTRPQASGVTHETLREGQVPVEYLPVHKQRREDGAAVDVGLKELVAGHTQPVDYDYADVQRPAGSRSSGRRGQPGRAAPLPKGRRKKVGRRRRKRRVRGPKGGQGLGVQGDAAAEAELLPEHPAVAAARRASLAGAEASAPSDSELAAEGKRGGSPRGSDEAGGTGGADTDDDGYGSDGFEPAASTELASPQEESKTPPVAKQAANPPPSAAKKPSGPRPTAPKPGQGRPPKSPARPLPPTAASPAKALLARSGGTPRGATTPAPDTPGGDSTYDDDPFEAYADDDLAGFA